MSVNPAVWTADDDDKPWESGMFFLFLMISTTINPNFHHFVVPTLVLTLFIATLSPFFVS